MRPILYKATETNFNNNGIGILTDSISCIVSETRNGPYEMVLKYPISGEVYSKIEEDMIVKAKANNIDPPQLFRLHKVSKPLNGVITWYGEHISYDLNDAPVDEIHLNNESCAGAINKLLAASPIECPFNAYSDISAICNVNISDVVSVRSAIGGVEGSILDTFGGELHFNNFNIQLLKNRGKDSGVELRYGKNIIDATMEKNISNVITAIYPYAKYFDVDNNTEVKVTLPEKIITTKNSGAYARLKCVPVDLSSTWEYAQVITEDMLRDEANQYATSGIDEPNISLKVSYVELSKSSSDSVEILEQINLCDTVAVYIEKLKISVKSKVVKYNYDSLNERCDSVEIGNVRPNLARQMSRLDKETKENKVTNKHTYSTLLQTIVEATNAITGNSGGYVMLKPATNPEEILIMDTPDVKTAKNVWRWNLAGLGHSSNGINGPFETAITADGKIAGQFIAAGSITAESLSIGYKNSVVGKGQVSSQLSVEDGNIKIQGNRFELYSDNFEVSPEGVTTQKEAYITGGAIDMSTGTTQRPVISMHFTNASGNDIKSELGATGLQTWVDGVLRSLYLASNAALYMNDATGTTVSVISSNMLSTTGSKNRIVNTDEYGSRLMYCYEMPMAMFGDIGRGIIGEDGICVVDVEPIFQETINTEVEYFVFCQGEVEVIEKQPTYFVVSGIVGTCFDWELKARQKGYDTERLDVWNIDTFQDFNYIASASEYLEKYEEELIYGTE